VSLASELALQHAAALVLAFEQILQTTTSDEETIPTVQDGQLDHNVGRMRYQTMDLLIKMSRLLQHKKLGTTFLVVNFHHVCLVPFFPQD